MTTNLRPILFLDVDGVLNTTKSKTMYSISKGCLRRLEGIVKDTGCKLVLSSTWRRFPEAKSRLLEVFAYRGLGLAGQTPYLPNDIRGQEIQAYLISSNQLHHRYAILDDDSDMMGYQLPHFFQTDPDYGLTNTIAYRVTYHFTGEYDAHRSASRTTDHP